MTLQMYQDALKAHWKSPLYSTPVGVIYRNMAHAYISLELYEEALEAYQQCRKLVPALHPRLTQHRRFEPHNQFCIERVAELQQYLQQ